MLMRNQLYDHLSNDVINNVTKLVDEHFRYGWAIRIEYADEVEYLNTSWDQWGEAFFNITDVSALVDSIRSCHNKNQFYAIRLRAEKFHPRSIFYFCVCQ